MTIPRERILAKLKTEFDDSANPPSNMDIADYSMYQGKAIAFDKAIEIVEREIAESDAENEKLREALKRIRGWRAIGSADTLGEKLRAIETICDDALEDSQ